jgi:hypothetical protein
VVFLGEAGAAELPRIPALGRVACDRTLGYATRQPYGQEPSRLHRMIHSHLETPDEAFRATNVTGNPRFSARLRLTNDGDFTYAGVERLCTLF